MIKFLELTIFQLYIHPKYAITPSPPPTPKNSFHQSWNYVILFSKERKKKKHFYACCQLQNLLSTKLQLEQDYAWRTFPNIIVSHFLYSTLNYKGMDAQSINSEMIEKHEKRNFHQYDMVLK